MNGVLLAELAIFFKLDSVGIVLFVFHIVVIALFALGACKRNTRSRCSRHICSTPLIAYIEK
jgi:hypothetical protein